MSNWYDDNAKGGYIYGPLEVPKENPLEMLKESDEPPHEGITLGEYMKEMFDTAIKKRDARISELEKENAELRGIITRVSRVTDAGEAYKIEREDEDRMYELVKQWEKELSK